MSIIFLLNKEASGFLKRLQGFLVVYMYMYMFVYFVNHYLTHCCIEFHFYPNEIQSRKHLWICLYHIIIFVSSQHATKLVYMSPNQNFFSKFSGRQSIISQSWQMQDLTTELHFPQTGLEHLEQSFVVRFLLHEPRHCRLFFVGGFSSPRDRFLTSLHAPVISCDNCCINFRREIFCFS